LFQVRQRIPSSLVDPDHLVELEVQRRRITILRVLDDEDHQKRDDRSASIYEELPRIGPTKKWTGHSPDEDGKNSEQKRGRATELLLDSSREASEERWSRLFGQLPGRNKLKGGSRLLV